MNIGFIHVDLNDGEIEVQCLEKLWGNVMSGGIILLDDFGWKKYESSYRAHQEFFKSKGQTVLEMPSGVGMVIKR